ncbi:DMT family transporter [Nereida sp. MMG025]|uniref:DMT family transporter n=1 Tax=Nereida sp. MMG025 TaxID=2909981 RepID=UPI001F1DADE8|nr:DMT family transporter [Nereida sp. MMG025]MCF6444481.1 DMT family transporter [Nereida sp. MMG025]
MLKSNNAIASLFALLAFAIFSAHDVIVKFLGGSYQPFQILFFSVLFGFPMVLLMLMRESAPDTLIPRHPWWTALRTAAAVLTGISIFFAFSILPLTQTYAIIFASPLLITILSIPILGETVGWRRWLAVLVGLIGVMIVLRPGGTQLGLGHLAALMGAFGGALASVIVRKIGKDERPVVLLLYPMMANFVLMAIALPFIYVPMPLDDLAGTMIMAILVNLAGLCLIRAYRDGDASIVAPMQYSQIIWATLFGVLLFDEYPDQFTLIGAGVIILSGVYIVLREGTKDASETTPVLRTRSRPETGTAMRVSPILRERGLIDDKGHKIPSADE